MPGGNHSATLGSPAGCRLPLERSFYTHGQPRTIGKRVRLKGLFHSCAPGGTGEEARGSSGDISAFFSTALKSAGTWLGLHSGFLRCSQSLAAWQLPLLSRSNLGIYGNEQNIERDTPVHYRGTRGPQPTEAVPSRDAGGNAPAGCV